MLQIQVHSWLVNWEKSYINLILESIHSTLYFEHMYFAYISLLIKQKTLYALCGQLFEAP